MIPKVVATEVARYSRMTPITAEAAKTLSWWDILLFELGSTINPFSVGFFLVCIIAFPVMLQIAIESLRTPPELENVAQVHAARNGSYVRLQAEVDFNNALEIRLPRSTFQLLPVRGLEKDVFLYHGEKGPAPGRREGLVRVSRKGWTGSWNLSGATINKLPERFRAVGRSVSESPIVLIPKDSTGKYAWLVAVLAGVFGLISVLFLLWLALSFRRAIRMIRDPAFCADLLNEELGLV